MSMISRVSGDVGMADDDLEAEIQRELQRISDADCVTEQIQDEEDINNNEINDQDELPESVLQYLERVQTQAARLEDELMDCDAVLLLQSARSCEQTDDSLAALAKQHGVDDVNSFKLKIIAELDQEEEKEKVLKSSSESKTNDLQASVKSTEDGLPTTKSGQEDKTQVMKGEGEGQAVQSEGHNPENCNMNSNGPKANGESLAVVPSLTSETGALVEATDPEVLEQQVMEQLWQWEEHRLNKETQRRHLEDSRKRTEQTRMAELERQRLQKLKDLENEQIHAAQLQKDKEQQLHEELANEEKKVQESLNIYQLEIEKLAAEISKEQKTWQAAQQQQQQEMQIRRSASATKIQAVWRGHRVRKIYKSELQSNIAKRKAEKEAALLKEIEEKRRQESERKKMEEERLKEEQRKKDDMKKLEQKRREEEERKLDEEKRLNEEKRIEELKRKEEEKKLEEEKRKEEIKRAEEEKKIMEEVRMKEELKKQEELKKERLEEEKRKKEEEMRREEEREKREMEDKKKKEEADRKKMELEEKQKEEQRRKEEKEKVKKEEERRLQEEKKKKENKAKQELKTRKPSSGKKPLRRPVSAKKLPPLADDVILSAACALSLQQVTTVELKDLPGFSTGPLGGCKAMKHLVINNCHLVALEGLEQHSALQYVDLKTNALEMINFLHVSTLLWLDVSHNNISTIHGLDGCSNLRSLNLSHNRITRIGGLECLTSLQVLDLSHNQLITTKGLQHVPTVQELNLSHNHLPGLDDLAPLSLLTRLNASANNLLQVPKLENQVLLRELILSDNSLSSIEELTTAWLPLLRTLTLSNNGLTEVSSISNLVSLQVLDVASNQLIDIDSVTSGCKDCRQLVELILNENPVTEETNYRCDIQSQVVTLRKIDGQELEVLEASSETMLTSFEAMCLGQNQAFENLQRAYQDIISKGIKTGDDLVKVHTAYFEESHTMAEENRFCHEFGAISSHVETTSKVNFNNLVQKSSFVSYQKPSAKTASSAQASSMKNKFQDALNKVQAPRPPSTPKSQGQLSRSHMLSSRSSSQCEMQVSSEDPGSSESDSKLGGESVGIEGQPFTKQSQEVASMSDVGPRLQSEVKPGSQHEVSPRSKKSNSEQESRSEVQQTVNERKPATSVRASTVHKILLKEQPLKNTSVLQHRAATLIQARWRGYSIRKEINKLTERHLAAATIQALWRGYAARKTMSKPVWEKEDIPRLSAAAVKIQALWRGYTLRKRLLQAMDYAKLQYEDDLDEDELPEIDLDDFNFNEIIGDDWLPPDTPQIPSSHPVLKSRTPAPPRVNAFNDQLDIPAAGSTSQLNMTTDKDLVPPIQLFSRVPQVPPAQAWDSTSALDNKPPLPPLSRFSNHSDMTLPTGLGETSRTGLSRRSDKLAEEWGFKDSKTAELMVARAKKLKYNAQKKKKFGQLDPKQRLALFRKLEEASHMKPVQPPQKKTPARMEYFQAKEEEAKALEVHREREKQQKTMRTFEWLHTQVSEHDSFTTRTSQGNTNLPLINPEILAGGRVHLMASPSLELQSVGSESMYESSRASRRHSSASEQNGVKVQLPCIKTGSAPSSHIKERMSFRDAPVEKSAGWGSGRRRGRPK